jgi:hypothetical protein
VRESAARRRPAAAIQLPDRDRLDRDELRRLAKAERKLASPDRSLAAAGQRDIREIERAHADRLAARRLAERLTETSDLAVARGEDVRTERVTVVQPMLDEHGGRAMRDGAPLYRRETVYRVRVVSRGGLQLAYERGDLDGGAIKAERLLATARAYRWAFETCAARTTVRRDLGAVSARSPLRASAGPQDSVFAAGEALRVFRAGLTARGCAVLDQVCGLDATVRQAAITLSADPRTIRRTLVAALVAATESQQRARTGE